MNIFYKVSFLIILLIPMTLALFVLTPVQSVSAGWITSNVFGGGTHLTDDILGIDPPSKTTPAVAQTPLLTMTPFVISCQPSQASVNAGGMVTWSSTATGAYGNYTYSWSGTDSLSGSSSSVSKSYSTAGTKNAQLTVTSKKDNCSCTKTETISCSVQVVVNTPNLSVSCSTNPSSIQTGNSATFSPVVSGGTGAYTYLWSGACTGTSINCTNNFTTAGVQTATVTVTSGAQTASANCPVTIGTSCTPNYQQRCVGNSMYWYDSCGAQGSYVGTCGTTCTPNYQQRCVGNSMYWYDSCGAQGSYVGTCGTTCTPNFQERCLGNGLYWFDSCGVQGGLVQYCANGCSGNSCTYNSNAYLTITKTVRDLTTGSVASNSTYANPSDMLMFMITVQNTSNQDANNVVVRDILPANLIYNSQLVVARPNGSYGNYSGDIVYGVNLNTIPANQTATITYQTQVASAANFAYGTTTLNNNVSLTSSNTNSGNATASVIVTKAGVLGASTVATGLTNNFWVDSFFLPLLLTLIGLWMWKSGMFFGIEKWLDNKNKIRKGYKAEKELSNRIELIRKAGK